MPSRANPPEPELADLFGFFDQHIRGANRSEVLGAGATTGP